MVPALQMLPSCSYSSSYSYSSIKQPSAAVEPIDIK